MQQHDMRQPLDPNSVFMPETPSQTAGPYVHIGLALDVAGLPLRDNEIDNVMATDKARGQRIHISGQVMDGNDMPIHDVLVEAWQADADGNYDTDYSFDKAFNSYGRTAPGMGTGEGVPADGRWTLTTIKPGRVMHPDGKAMAPHINMVIFARGVNIHLHTRLYFDDEGNANAECPFLNRVPEERRPTLIATRKGDNADGEPEYEFIIRAQGHDSKQETVFFDF